MTSTEAGEEDGLVRAIIDRRNRVIGSILRCKESAIDPYLGPDSDGAELRRTVLREVNGFADFVMDVLATVRDDRLLVNQLWLDKLNEIHAAVVDVPTQVEPVLARRPFAGI